MPTRGLEQKKNYVTRGDELEWKSYEEKWPEAWEWDKMRFKLLISDDVSGDWGNLTLIRAELDPGESHRLHHHPQPAFYHVLKGKGTMILGDEELEVRPGTTIYIPSNAKHEITNTGEVILCFLGCETPHGPGDYQWDLEEMRHVKKRPPDVLK